MRKIIAILVFLLIIDALCYVCTIHSTFKKNNKLDPVEFEMWGAYLLYGNFSEKFPSNGTVFLAPKTGTGLSCTIYKIPVKFSLSHDMKPRT